MALTIKTQDGKVGYIEKEIWKPFQDDTKLRSIDGANKGYEFVVREGKLLYADSKTKAIVIENEQVEIID